MTWFMMHGNQFFILFLVPILGFIFDLSFSRKIILCALFISLFLLLPIVTGYDYVLPYVYQVMGFIFLGCLYALYSRQIGKLAPKIISAVVMTILAFGFLGYFAFMDSMSGSEKVEESWRVQNYKVEYIRDRGFAGRALMKYEISRFGLIPIFIKKVDFSIVDDTSTNCVIHFNEIKKDFDKCKTTLTDTEPN